MLDRSFITVKRDRIRFFLKTDGAVARLGKMFNLAVSFCAANDRSIGQQQGAKILGSKCYWTTNRERLQSFDDLLPSIVKVGTRSRVCVCFLFNCNARRKCGASGKVGKTSSAALGRAFEADWMPPLEPT